MIRVRVRAGPLLTIRSSGQALTLTGLPLNSNVGRLKGIGFGNHEQNGYTETEFPINTQQGMLTLRSTFTTPRQRRKNEEICNFSLRI